jgi:hypothetical protein
MVHNLSIGKSMGFFKFIFISLLGAAAGLTSASAGAGPQDASPVSDFYIQCF